MIIRARAPLRVSVAGGGTDVSPYPERYGGLVLSATINKYAYCSLWPKRKPSLVVRSLDYDTMAEFERDEHFTYDGNLDLVKAAFKRICGSLREVGGAEIFLHSDTPPGTGLGASSTVVVALASALARWRNLSADLYQIARWAFEIERQDVGIRGGKQDQYAAAFGGFNLIEFTGDQTVVVPLRIRPELLLELEYHLILCYTGRARTSAGIIERQVRAYEREEEQVIGALHQMKQTALDMKNALLTGELRTFAELLHLGWEAKKKLDPAISNPHIDQMYAEALNAGALGGKLLGAGGGGHLLFFTRFERRHLVEACLERLGGKIVEFNFEPNGVQAWEVPSERAL
jgi:D-glycero-alpha-D-manno-heptose-7-phosphate kinase